MRSYSRNYIKKAAVATKVAADIDSIPGKSVTATKAAAAVKLANSNITNSLTTTTPATSAALK